MVSDTKRGAAWVTVNAKHNGVMVTLDALREQLAAQGLHVVTDADKAVLDAMARIPEAILRDAAGMYGHLAPSMDDLKAPVRAEIARRGLK